MRAATILCAVLLVVLGTSALADEMSERADMFEEIFDRFFAIRACAQGETPYDLAWSDYEVWREEQATRRASQQDSLSTLYAPIEVLNAAIEALEQREKALRDQGVAAHDDSLHALEHRRFGYLAARTDSLVVYNQALARHYRAQQLYIGERNARLKNLDVLVRDVEEYNLWLQAGGPRIYSGDLDRLLVEVRRKIRDDGESEERSDVLARVRSLRRRLVEHTIVRDRREGLSVLVVEVDVGGEPCFLYVDSGADKVLLSQEMVDALGWEDLLGEYVALVNADGTTAEARRLYIPDMAYGESSAQNVEATVLDWSRLGSDGLLGMSFLGLFEIEIDEAADPPLVLKPKD